MARKKAEAEWWQELFADGPSGAESATIGQDRRFIVISHIMCSFTNHGGGVAQLRFNDFYSPTFWLEVDFVAETKQITRVAGRHTEAVAFHMEKKVFGDCVMPVLDPIAVSTRPKFCARISKENVLTVWDVQHPLFEIVCDVSKVVKVVSIK